MKYRVMLSLLAVLSGWASGFVYFVAYMSFFTPWGRPTDVEATLFWSGVFILFAWIILIVPLVVVIPDSSRLFGLPLAPLFGGVSGLIIFLLLVGWWTGFWTEGLYLGYAVVVGAASGLAYSILLRWHDRTKGKAEGRRAA